MAEKFDAYHQWLGVSPEEQPPNHYRLLGLKDFEADVSVIGNASDRQMTHVRKFQLGAHAAESQQLMNELASAAITLLNPALKKNYDVVLQSAKPADALTSEKAPPASVTGELPKEFGPYIVIERTSVGPLGVTFKVQHRPSGRFFTLKTLPAAAARNEEVVKRLRREIDIVTKLDHFNLIAGVDSGEVNGVPYLVTEYVVGMDLAALVKHQGPLPVESAVDFIAQAARGLTQLHLAGVVHRNLKPQSLLVDMQGRIRITNLLLARVHEASSLAKGEELTQMGEMMGTVEYQAPEQFVNAAGVDGRADIYSLGCTLHYLLTGQPPYPGKSLMEKVTAHRQRPIPSLRAVRNDVPPAVDSIFQKMLAKEVTQRQEFVGQLLDQLERLKSGPENAEQNSDVRGEWLDSYTLAVTLGAVTIVALVAFLIWRLMR